MEKKTRSQPSTLVVYKKKRDRRGPGKTKKNEGRFDGKNGCRHTKEIEQGDGAEKKISQIGQKEEKGERVAGRGPNPAPRPKKERKKVKKKRGPKKGCTQKKSAAQNEREPILVAESFRRGGSRPKKGGAQNGTSGTGKRRAEEKEKKQKVIRGARE